MRKSRVLVLVGLLSAVAVITGACSKEGGGTIKLGFVGDITGKNSSIVVPGLNAAKLAVKLANANGVIKKKIEIVALDNKDASSDAAPGLAQKLISDDSVVGVIGPAFSGETDAAAPLFANAGLTNITQSATRPDLTTHGWKTFFRGLGNDNLQGGVAGNLVVNYLGKHRVAVVNDKSPYGAGLSAVVVKSVQAAGGQIVLNQGVEPTTDYSAVVASVIKANPEVLYYAGYDSEAPLLVKQYREKGGTATFMGGDGDKGSGLLKEGGKDVEGSILTCPCGDPNQSKEVASQKFAAAYKKEYNAPADIYSAEGFDVASIFIAAIKAGGDNVTRKSVLDFVTNLKDFKGVSKTFNWTATHEVKGGITYAYLVKNGKYVLLGKADTLKKAA